MQVLNFACRSSRASLLKPISHPSQAHLRARQFSFSAPFCKNHADAVHSKDPKAKVPKNIVLCFDGTGNTFRGTDGDTNVAKLLGMLDRTHPDQFHYYQTGIGTYEIGETSVNKTILGGIRSTVVKAIDQGFGVTFDGHVIAGYRFLMEYYKSGAKIYIFGFSRGAYTARFLAAMIYKVGLLCKGNEEMVPFAYKLYQNYLEELAKKGDKGIEKFHPHPALQKKDKGPLGQDPALVIETTPEATPESTHPTNPARACGKDIDAVAAFTRTFCRRDKGVEEDIDEQNIKVHFLGLWDCVGSVAVLEQKAPVEIPVNGTAKYIRHAVSVDERRVKFKPALFLPDCRHESGRVKMGETQIEAIKEVWFPGNHGDVGGGWSSAPKPAEEPKGAWENLKGWFSSLGAPTDPKEKEPIQMSDIPLDWMVSELDAVAAAEKKNNRSGAGLQWRTDTREIFERHIAEKSQDKFMTKSFMHDTLKFGRGSSFLKVIFWNFMEWLPLIITRQEFNGSQWVPRRWPLNRGGTRDMPKNATLHASLVHRWSKADEYNYHPKNDHGDNSSKCFTDKTKFESHDEDVNVQSKNRHSLFEFKQ